MGLREIAEQDLALTLEDIDGFGYNIQVTDPAGLSKPLVGRSGDIGQAIDVDTGQLVSGRTASVSLRISSLTAAGLGLPEAVADSTSKPWRITFDDINGVSFAFKVSQSAPDRTLGLVTCHLENWED